MTYIPKPGTIFGIIRIHGGYAPPRRTRNPQHLQLSEREDISRGLAQKLSIRAIARQFNRAPSTILREIRRHGGSTHYRAHHAQERALERASRPKSCKLALNAELCEQARADVFDYIEMFHNRKRRHSYAQQLSPVEYEKQYF